MAAKFQIFCDGSPAKLQDNSKGARREPLGLKQMQLKQQQASLQQLAPAQPQQPQPLSQQHQQHQPQPLSQQQQQQAHYQPLQQVTYQAAASAGPSLVEQQEDQENDISMVSLGSDFVPSIFSESNSFELAEEEDDLTCNSTTDEDHLNIASDRDAFASESFETDAGQLHGLDVELSDDDDIDDEELQQELSQAFKRLDDANLFKSIAYIQDIEAYLQNLEREPTIRPLPNYMAFQRHIDSDKRAILTNWLVEVSDEYELHTETLFMCTNIIDRFLSRMSIPTINFQLLGVAAMFVASKYEEIYPPFLHQFVEVTDDTYSGQQILQMEQEILKTLDFRISMPTVTFFLKKIFAFNKFSKRVYHMAEYLCHLSLLVDQPFLEYYPSEIAIASVILAAHQLGASESISAELKSAYDKSNQCQLERRRLPNGLKLSDIDRRAYIVDQQLPFCIESLRAIQECAFKRSPSLKADTAVYLKFSSEANSRVSLIPPPKSEDLQTY